MKRRNVLHAAWSAPVILATTATPARAASADPVDVNPCTNGTLTAHGVDPWQGNDSGRMFQGVRVTNQTATALTVHGRVEHASAHLTGVDGADTFTLFGKVNARFTATIPAGGFVVLRVRVEGGSDNSACWLWLDDCALRVHLKTVGFQDRIEVAS